MIDVDLSWHVRLSEERALQWGTQSEAAKSIGLAPSQLSRYEAGGAAPGLEVLQQLARSGIDVLYVLTGRREAPQPVRPDTVQAGGANFGGAGAALDQRQSRQGPAHASGPADGARVLRASIDGHIREYQVIDHINEPVCAGKPAAGGAHAGATTAATTTGTTATADAAHGAAHQAGPLAFERAWMAQALGRADDAYLSLTVEGDSMAPTLLHGEMLVIDAGVQRVNVSGIYVLRFGPDLTIKRITKRSDESLVISSDNPQYARGDETFSRDQAAVLRVIGRLVWPRVR